MHALVQAIGLFVQGVGSCIVRKQWFVCVWAVGHNILDFWVKYFGQTLVCVCVCVQGLGYSILSTGGTHKHLKASDVDCEVVLKIQEGRPNIGDLVKNGDIAMMLITSTGAISQLTARFICFRSRFSHCFVQSVSPSACCSYFSACLRFSQQLDCTPAWTLQSLSCAGWQVACIDM